MSEENSPLLNSNSVNDDEDGVEGCGSFPVCNPKSCIHKFFPVLVLICFLSFGKSFLVHTQILTINYQNSYIILCIYIFGIAKI